VYKVPKEKIQDIIDNKFYLTKDTDKIESFLADFEVIHEIKGYFTMYLKFDGKKIWKYDNRKTLLKGQNPRKLPSDSTFRKDIIYKTMGDNEKA